MADEDRFEDLLLAWEELKAQGRPGSPEELCRDCPELLALFRERIAALEKMAWLDDELAGLRASPSQLPAGSQFPTAPSLAGGEPSGTPGISGPILGASAPSVLGDYTLLERIGVGGMGQVFKAVHRHMQRVVALKIVREDAVASAEAIARFRREVKAAARLDHPNIVTAHDAGEDRGICYLVMEFVDGCDLARQVRQGGPLSVAQAADCVIQAARGLAYAHEQGITHRDIKPANLLLGKGGTVKVLDMGLARFREGSAPEAAASQTGLPAAETESRDADLTHTGTIHGTITYMAPEQRENSKDADHRADIYSLGCTLHFLLTGNLVPRRGTEAAGRSTGPADAGASLRRQRPDASPALAAVLAKMTAPRPDDRYASMSQVIEALQAATDSGPNAARRRARRRAVRLLLAVISASALFLTGWAGYEAHGHRQAATLTARLLDAPTAEAPAIVSALAPYRRWVDPRLRTACDDARASHDFRRQLRASLGLLPVDKGQVDFLYQRLLVAEAPEFPILRDALREHQSELIERLWSVWGGSDQGLPPRLRAACALATYAPRDARWSFPSGEVAVTLVAEPAGELEHWTECLRPVRDHLEAHLRVNFQLRGQAYGAKPVAAAQILASWFADDPKRLVDLLMDADAAQFAVLAPAIDTHRPEAQSLLETELARPVPAESDAQATWARRQANARAALLRFGQPERAWPWLKHSPDPTLRSYLIHRLGPSGADPELLVERLKHEKDVSVRRALILACGGFPEDRLSGRLRDSLIHDLLALYRDDPDPGIHGAAEWLFRRWGQDAKLKEIRAAANSLGRRGWYVSCEGQTMVVVPGPVEFLMGSPPSERGAGPDEMFRRTSIARAFAIGAKEVTVEEFGRFLRENPDVSRGETDDQSEGPDQPQTCVTWQAAAAYCRWLSRKEGMPEDEMCYPPVSATAGGLKLSDDFLGRKGYRLPTEAEWEYACRAGSRTIRFYGNADDLLDEYAWSSRRALSVGTRSVGMLKPNDFGLFDQYGNVLEWCHHAGDENCPESRPTARGGTVTSYPAERFRLRGASHRNRREEMRSAGRFSYKPGRMITAGFRLARTLPARSLAVVNRGQPFSGKAEFLVLGPQAPFVVKGVQGGVEVLPAGGTTPARLRVTAPDRQTRAFSFQIERTDAPETVTARGILFSADWNLEFHAWDRADRDELNQPADWQKVVAGTPLAVRKSTHVDFDWETRAPARNVPPDYFALVATAKCELPAGRYELWATADNGVRVFIDGIKRIDFNLWLPDRGTSNLVELRLESGEHSFRVEFYEARDHARLQVDLRALE